MGLSAKKKARIIYVIKDCLRRKFQHYNPETRYMPFHYRLLGKDRMAPYSFIQSLNTSFGTSIYEPVAVEIATDHFEQVEAQYVLGQEITQNAQTTIQQILDRLSTASVAPNKKKEIEAIRKICQTGQTDKKKTVKADIYVKTKDDEIFLFDLKTTKPNKSNFENFKKTLLEWVGIELYKNPNAKINTLLSMPYNPYEPKPYQRWTAKGMLDLDKELMVGEEFWKFLGGEGAYQDLLDCFETAGIQLRTEIDNYFSRFQNG